MAGSSHVEKELRMPKSLAFLIATCDADAKHFSRVLGEFTRLGYPFAAYFDHCCEETIRLFASHLLCVGSHINSNEPFDERHRRYPFDILKSKGFDWIASIDTDEIFDGRAATLIPEILDSDADVVWCPRLDFWGDDRHYRIDGPFGPSTSGVSPGKQFCEKFFNVKTGIWTYRHADIHAPYFAAVDKTGRAPIRKMSPLYVLHYGIMDYADAVVHTDRWNLVYTRAQGANKHPGFYNYINDKSIVPTLIDFDPANPPSIEEDRL